MGSSYLMSDVLAAFLFGQLEAWERIHHARRLIWERYQNELIYWAADRGIQTPTVPAHCEYALRSVGPDMSDENRSKDDIAANLP